MALSAIAKRILENAMFSGPEAREITNAIDAATNQATNGTIANSLTFANNANMVFNTTNGTMFGTNANQKSANYGATPVVQPSATGELLGFLGNGATNANAVNFTANGNLGTKAYSLGDVVKALKQRGDLASS